MVGGREPVYCFKPWELLPGAVFLSWGSNNM